MIEAPERAAGRSPPAGPEASAAASEAPPPPRSRGVRAGPRRTLLVLALLAAAAVVAVVVHRAVTRPVTVRVGQVVPGEVREETIGPATIQSRYSVAVASRMAGSLDDVLVDVGDEVTAGQLLATLDRAELDARLRAARGAVASAEKEVDLASANLAKARAELDLARLRDARARQLADVLSAAEVDEAGGALEAASAAESAARAAVDGREAELARLRHEEQVAETVLSYTTLHSPMDGVITRRQLEAGSTVAPGSVVFQIVDADSLWAATLIDQSLAGRVELGQRAIVRLRSGDEIQGRVARIAFEADPVTRELEVDVAFDARPARFAIHEEADVTILGPPVPGLTVPLAAVSHGPDGAAVFVVQDGEVHRRPVRLGAVGAGRGQVLEGLEAGQTVVLAPRGLRDGQRVAAGGEGR